MENLNRDTIEERIKHVGNAEMNNVDYLSMNTSMPMRTKEKLRDEMLARLETALMYVRAVEL